MRATSARHSERGFTLIEVMVALGIAAGSLVLILSATSTGLRRSSQAALDVRLARAAESKVEEWRIGAEQATEGALAGFDGHRWEIRMAPESVAGLKLLKRLTFTVYGPGGVKVFERSELLHGRGTSP